MEFRLIVIKDNTNIVKEFSNANDAIEYLIKFVPKEDLVLKEDEEVIIQKKKKPNLVDKLLGNK